MDPYENNNKKILSPLDKEPYEPETTKKNALADKGQETVVALTLPSTDSSATEWAVKDVVKSLFDHLADLRKQLIKGLAVFIFFFFVVFATVNWWFPFITKGNSLVILGPLEVVKFYMSISSTMALGLALPFLMHFVWSFIKPGLKENERRFLGMYSPVMLFLFLLGISFGFFVVNPLSYKFLISIGQANFDVMVSASEYIHFLIMTTVPIGILFELPIVALFLSSIGLLTADIMKAIRKWAYVFMAVFASMTTPPDFVSHLLVLIPMILLYEISIFLVKKIERKQMLKNAISE